MNTIKSLKYLVIIILTYLGLTVLELLLLGPLVKGLELGWFLELFIFLVFILLINPIITYRISNKIEMNPDDLKTKGGIKEAYKKV